jgi:mRNA-degrading endonuclease RelE of RelBE toxin-antitoxin system
MSIEILPGAQADLEALALKNPRAAATIATFLEEAHADSDIVDKCTSATPVEIVIGQFPVVSARPWINARGDNDNLFRFRLLETPATNYRVVYGYDWRSRQIGILAVVKRKEFDYGLSGDLARRIRNDWRDATGGRPT